MTRLRPRFKGLGLYGTATPVRCVDSARCARTCCSCSSTRPGATRSSRTARRRGRGLREAARAGVDDGAGAIAARLERWIGDAGRRPFLWYVNLVECHSPYLPPRPYGDASIRDRLRAAEAARRYYTLDAIWRAG